MGRMPYGAQIMGWRLCNIGFGGDGGDAPDIAAALEYSQRATPEVKSPFRLAFARQQRCLKL
jgi:hypothetical protein